MWEIEKQKLSKPSKIKVTFSLDKELVQRFKNVADKEARNYSKVVNMYLLRYMNSGQFKRLFFHWDLTILYNHL